MNIEEIEKILAVHDTRLSMLEDSLMPGKVLVKQNARKQITLRELVKGRKFKNGQEQIAVIVGYHEKIVNALLSKDKIGTEWKEAKMERIFSAEFISRAKGTLIRISKEGLCDLTQSGEEFFDEFIKNEPTNSTSK